MSLVSTHRRIISTGELTCQNHHLVIFKLFINQSANNFLVGWMVGRPMIPKDKNDETRFVSGFRWFHLAVREGFEPSIGY